MSANSARARTTVRKATKAAQLVQGRVWRARAAFFALKPEAFTKACGPRALPPTAVRPRTFSGNLFSSEGSYFLLFPPEIWIWAKPRKRRGHHCPTDHATPSPPNARPRVLRLAVNGRMTFVYS
eukprot:1977362-Prymnesium_polylepis.1